MYTNSFKITELDDDKALPLKTDDIHGMSVYYLPNKACSISSPNCMMERDSEQVPSVNDLTHSLSQISQQNWDPNFAYQSAPEIDPSQRFCFNKTTAEIDNLYRLPSPPHEPYSNSHRNYQLNYFISQIQNPSIDSVQDYYCDNNNINVSGFPSALYNHQAVSTMETIKPISTVFGSTDSDVSQYSGYSAFSKQNMTNITTSDGQYSMLSESLQHRMPQDDIIKRSDWQNHVGHGLTELLYPFNDCTVIDTDTQFNIISCWTSNKEHMAQQKVFDYRFEYLKKKNINILFTERCKERIFRDRESNSYDETIVFCGDIIYIITGSRRNNRKWMSLWVKEKKNNANQIIGYVFILVDNCKLICHIKIDNKGTILGAHKPSGPGTSHHQTKKDGIPYDMEYFLKYPQNMIKGMSYHKALGELDKPLITFHGLHYFIAKPDPELETNVLDVVAIKYITGMASISWKAEEFIWASETLSGCLFGETENPRHIEGQPVMKRLPQLPSVIDQFHQQNSNPNMNDGNEQERPCITGMNYAKCENDNGSMLFSNLDQLMDSETSNHDHVIYTNDDLNCSMCINNNSDDMDYEKINYIKNGILHGSIMKYDDCILNAFVAGVWRTGKVHRFTAKSKNGSEYKFEHMSIQLSYNKSIPHWVFLKYRFIPQWSTDSNEYHKIQKIGKGSYGTTHQALDLATLDQVTVKTVPRSRVVKEHDQKKKTSLPIEIEILKRLQQNSHPNCCAMLYYYQDDTDYHIVMRNYGKTLYNFIEENPNLDEPGTRSIFKQIADAIYHLHIELQVVHRDIKDENVMIDSDRRVRLIDFGSAAYIKTNNTNNKRNGTFNIFVGTIDYASPEVLTGNRYTGPPQDIWALGVLLYTMVHHSNPFHSPEDIVKKNLIFPFHLPKDLKALIDGMLEPNISSRFDIQKVVNHKWLQTSSN